MTREAGSADGLDAEFAEVAGEIARLAEGSTDRPALEARVSRLCDAVLALPPDAARARLPALQQLITDLDAAATAIQARGGSGDSPAPARSARAAAAAYGAGQNRRRRGF